MCCVWSWDVPEPDWTECVFGVSCWEYDDGSGIDWGVVVWGVVWECVCGGDVLEYWVAALCCVCCWDVSEWGAEYELCVLSEWDDEWEWGCGVCEYEWECCGVCAWDVFEYWVAALCCVCVWDVSGGWGADWVCCVSCWDGYCWEWSAGV